MPIPIIDLFAGPGGLGEGFTSVVDKKGNRIFKIALSIERDEFAHRTLTLRSFLRQFPFKKLPNEYYKFLRGEIDVEDLYNTYPEQTKAAKEEAWQFELGNPATQDKVDRRIKKALNGQKNFVLIGGPPCQAYSLVGRARRQQGSGLDKEDERVYLYREYYRILGVHKPSVFIMENVKGLLSSKVENELIFKQLISDMGNPVESYRKLQGNENFASKIRYKIYSLVQKSSGNDLISGEPFFQPKDFIIRSEDYGIPQTRHRVILLGIRNDIDTEPEIIPKAEQVPINKVLSGLPPLRSGLSKEEDSKDAWKKTLKSFLNHPVKQEIDSSVWKQIETILKSLTQPQNDRGMNFISSLNISSDYNEAWFIDDKIKGVCNHETRSHIKNDLYRYLFAACFAKVHKRSPKLADFPVSLLPKHENVDVGVSENKFADRFRVQISGEPSKTVTSHISKDGHYYIHPDASQCRSLTVREAARVQTFPDNYYFLGPRTQQYHQVGNAVPPLLAYQIAKIVSSMIPN